MDLKRFFYAAMSATGLSVLASTTAQATDVGNSFDNQALAARLASSCAAQQTQRGQSMRPLVSPEGTAPAFKNKGAVFVIQSAHLDTKMKAEADKIFAAIPPHTKALAYNDGGVFVWPRYGMAEALPMRKHDANGYVTPGLYLSDERRLYLPFMLADVRKNRRGQYEPAGFYAEPVRRTRIINHETGHMMDDLLGNYSYEGGARTADDRLTDRHDFQDAFERDAQRLRRDRPAIAHLSYYFDRNVGGEQTEPQRLRREVFAELWAESSGRGGTNLSKFYLDTYRVVKSFYDHLATLHKAKGTPCLYKQDGTASTPPVF